MINKIGRLYFAGRGLTNLRFCLQCRNQVGFKPRTFACNAGTLTVGPTELTPDLG